MKYCLHQNGKVSTFEIDNYGSIITIFVHNAFNGVVTVFPYDIHLYLCLYMENILFIFHCLIFMFMQFSTAFTGCLFHCVDDFDFSGHYQE